MKILRAFLVLPVLLTVLLLALITPSRADWSRVAPENLPRVTVSWEDAAQQKIFVVQGAHYRCRVSTLPARVLSLSVDGRELLGAGGLDFAVENGGRVLTPAPADASIKWPAWRGQDWKTVTSPRARTNVWSAGPYYWDAHLLDIPLMSAADAAATSAKPTGAPLLAYDFAAGNADWSSLNNSQLQRAPDGALRINITGNDPNIQSPPLNLNGPLTVSLRMRAQSSGDAMIFWDSGDGYQGAQSVTIPVEDEGQWHDYTVSVPAQASVKRLRFDPPGEKGEVDLQSLRIYPAQAAPPVIKPVRGEIVFHAYPDKLHIEFRTDASHPDEKPLALPAQVRLQWDSAYNQMKVEGRPVAVLGQGSQRAVVLGTADTKVAGNIWRAPLDEARRSTFIVVQPLDANVRPDVALRDVLHPLSATHSSARGGSGLSYDATSGLYRASFDANIEAFGFEPAFRNPARRMELGLDIKNDDAPRNIVVKAATGVGNLEAGVLADSNGFPLPTPAWVAKNFGGEREEPDDSAFGDIYFPLQLGAGERRQFQVLGLTHGWGDHPLKQVSSVRFFHIYWHLSTGASETTCFSQDWMPVGSMIFQIPDFRPLSGPFWTSQPQHDCQQWPGFLQWNNGAGKLIYERTDFESISPNIARFSLFYRMSDDAGTARVDVTEIPQQDEMRTFLKVRYDWTKAQTIAGDARRNFRWLNIYEKRLPAQLLWTGADGTTQIRPVEAGKGVIGEMLSPDSPFAAASGRGDNYNSLVQIRRLSGRLGGKPFSQSALSANFGEPGQKENAYWLTVPDEKLQLQAGDFLEAELYLMPHGEAVAPALKPERERRDYGIGAGLDGGPRITDVTVGEKLADFPPRVRAAQTADDEAAAFTFTGGQGAMPLIVEGFRGYGTPLLWRNGVWQDQQVHGGDGYQVEPDEKGGYRFVFVSPHREGQTHQFVVSRINAPAGVKALRDRNGRLEIELNSSGPLTLRSPAIFGPGQNTVSADSPLIGFRGQDVRVTQLPLEAKVATGTRRITVSQWTSQLIKLQTDGAATLTVGGLTDSRRYTVTIDGKPGEVVANDGRLIVEVKAAAIIQIERRD